MHDARTVKSRTIHDRHIALLILAAVLTPHTATAQAIPLQASDAQVTNAGNLQYSLTSSAAQPATAWAVTIAVADPNGTVIRQTAVTLDEYRAEAQRRILSAAESARSLLRPGQTRRFEVPGPFDLRLLVTVTPAAMVFLDGTAVGDSVLVDAIFHRRAAERDARGEMLRQLLDVRTHYVGTAALKEAIARLSQSDKPDPGHARQLCQKHLRDALARNESDSTDAMAELSRQIDAIQREYDAAVQHATPRKED